jgi:peroxiredoxin
MAKLAAANAIIFGISVDSPFSNDAFAEANGIGFKLLSDINREVIGAYGVRLEDFVIEGFTVSQRAVFIIESDGSIGYVWVADSPGTEPHYDAVIAHCLNS